MLELKFSNLTTEQAEQLINTAKQFTSHEHAEGGNSDAAPKTSKGPKKPKEKSEKTPSKPKEITFAELAADFKAAVQRNYIEGPALLGEFKVKALKDLKKEQYEQFQIACKAVQEALAEA